MPTDARECAVCWRRYEPEVGDDERQIAPGTPFDALPADWRCPRCDSPKDRFVRPVVEPIDARVKALTASARALATTRMAGLPLNNPKLTVAATGFRIHGPGLLGALVTPWSINVVYFPGPAEPLAPERGHTRQFPAGTFTFLPQRSEGVPPFEQLSLFSPALEFTAQEDALTAASAALDALFTPAGDLHTSAPSRRALFGLADKRGGP